MNDSINILKKEHENILLVVESIEKECALLKSGKPINREFFEEIVNFIRNYADKLHHAKEEDILFKEMCKDEAQEKLHCNPIDQMLYEHNIGRDFVKGIKIALANNDKRELVNSAMGYAGLIREHIFKEDNILYPMAEQVLSAKTKKYIKDRFTKIDLEKSAEIKKYLNLIKKLKNKNGK